MYKPFIVLALLFAACQPKNDNLYKELDKQQALAAEYTQLATQSFESAQFAQSSVSQKDKVAESMAAYNLYSAKADSVSRIADSLLHLVK